MALATTMALAQQSSSSLVIGTTDRLDLSNSPIFKSGNLQYRHIMLYIYATKSDYINYNLWYKEVSSSNVNTFKIQWVKPNDEEVRVITDTILN